VFHKVEIKNFQSHKKTVIEFANGVNVIVGVSDNGKSAVLRAIIWAINNRPLGTDDIISHWARDDKNKSTDKMYVKIFTEKGVVRRQRTNDSNIYILNDDAGNEKIFEAINKEVPQDIINFFNLSDVNIQQQHDSPFLLSSSASDVAKYFNKIVRLDVIDTVLGNAESARRGYDWIERAQELSEKLNKIDEKIKYYDDDYNLLDGDIAKYETIKKVLEDTPDIKKANELIEKIENIKIDYVLLKEIENEIEDYKNVNRDRKIFDMVKEGKDIISEIDIYAKEIAGNKIDVDLLQKDIDQYNENKKISDMGFDKNEALQIIKEIERITPDYNLLRELNAQINEYNLSLSERDKLIDEIESLKKDLPDVCPECGQPLKECKE